MPGTYPLEGDWVSLGAARRGEKHTGLRDRKPGLRPRSALAWSLALKKSRFLSGLRSCWGLGILAFLHLTCCLPPSHKWKRRCFTAPVVVELWKTEVGRWTRTYLEDWRREGVPSERFRPCVWGERQAQGTGLWGTPCSFLWIHIRPRSAGPSPIPGALG